MQEIAITCKQIKKKKKWYSKFIQHKITSTQWYSSQKKCRYTMINTKTYCGFITQVGNQTSSYPVFCASTIASS